MTVKFVFICKASTCIDHKIYEICQKVGWYVIKVGRFMGALWFQHLDTHMVIVTVETKVMTFGGILLRLYICMQRYALYAGQFISVSNLFAHSIINIDFFLLDYLIKSLCTSKHKHWFFLFYLKFYNCNAFISADRIIRDH